MSEITAEHFISEYMGEKCPDFDEDCACCQAWKFLEDLKTKGDH